MQPPKSASVAFVLQYRYVHYSVRFIFSMLPTVLPPLRSYALSSCDIVSGSEQHHTGFLLQYLALLLQITYIP